VSFSLVLLSLIKECYNNYQTELVKKINKNKAILREYSQFLAGNKLIKRYSKASQKMIKSYLKDAQNLLKPKPMP